VTGLLVQEQYRIIILPLRIRAVQSSLLEIFSCFNIIELDCQFLMSRLWRRLLL